MASGAGGVMGAIGSLLENFSTRLATRERTRGILQEAQNAEIEAVLEEINATSAEGDLRDQLLRTLSANNAAMGASGLALGSPTGMATTQDDFSQAFGQISSIRLTSMLKAGALRKQARTMRKQAKYTSIAGNLGASAQTLQQAGSMTGGGSFGG